MQDRISWLHISDMHIKVGDDEDNSTLRNNFINSIKEWVESPEEHDIHFVIVTGDVAYAAQKEEYKLAEEFFAELADCIGIDRSKIFIVPGNHDLDRSCIKKGSAAKVLVDAYGGGVKSHRILEDIAQGDMVTYGCEGKFKNFHDSFQKGNKDALCSYYQNMVIEGYNIGVTGLNSAWLSAGAGECERGKMYVSKHAAMEVIKGKTLKNNCLNICAYHHPMNTWIEDTSDIKGYLMKEYDLMLCGHIHKNDNYTKINSASAEIAASAMYTGLDFHEGYSIFEYYPQKTDDNNIRVNYFRYSREDGGFFSPDTLSYKNAPQGHMEFRVGKSAAKSGKGMNKAPVKRIEEILQDKYLMLGRRKTAFPTDMSFREIYDNEMYVPIKCKDSANNLLSADSLYAYVLNNNCVMLGEPGSGKSFFTYCVVRYAQDNSTFSVVPIDLGELWHSFGGVYKPEIMSHITIQEGALYIVDALDEFCAESEKDKFCESIIKNLSSSGKVLLLCRRYEYERHVIDIIDSSIIDTILRIQEWSAEIEFREYLKCIEGREEIDTVGLYHKVISVSGLQEIVKRPLHARMLAYVWRSHPEEIIRLHDYAGLYQCYFDDLATTVNGAQADEVLSLWEETAWGIFKDGIRNSEEISVEDIPWSSTLVKERILSPLVNWASDVRQQKFSYIHYSFFEYMVASKFVHELEYLLRVNPDSADVIYKMFETDLPIEIRHYATLLMKRMNKVIFWNRLIDYYQEDCNSKLSDIKRMISNNLLLYFLGRISRIKPDQIRVLLQKEHNGFCRTSLYWSLCGLGDEEALADYFKELKSDDNFSALNRGYLLYYYGDIDRSAMPPYYDNNKKQSWEKTRIGNIRMFQRNDYGDLAETRRLIDVYTFLDFSLFHETILSDEDESVLKDTIKSVGDMLGEDNTVYDVVKSKEAEYCERKMDIY